MPRVGVVSHLKLHRDALLRSLATGTQYAGVDLSSRNVQVGDLDAVIVDVLDPQLNPQLARFARHEIPALVWGGFVFDDDVHSLVSQGARGYVSMIGKREEILSALDTIVHGGVWLPELKSQQESGLSPAQRRAMRVYLISGATDSRAEVAAAIGLSEKTLKNHIAAARRAVNTPTPTRPALRRALEARGWL